MKLLWRKKKIDIAYNNEEVTQEVAMKKVMIVLAITLMAGMLAAQFDSKLFSPDYYIPNRLNSSAINLQNLDMHHSVSFMSGFSSGSNQAFYQSMYTNHISYKISDKWNLKMNLNFVNYGSATYQQGIEFDGNRDNQSKVLPEFQLQFKPSENTSLTIEFRQGYGRSPWRE